MKILVTGATGLVGRALVSTLLKHKFDVHFLTSSHNKLLSIDGCKGFYWNPSKGIIDRNCLEGVEVIINLAGATITHRWTSSYKQEIINSRIAAARLLFETVSAHHNSVKQIINASGIAIYPDSDKRVYQEDEARNDGTFLADLVSKWEESVDFFQSLSIKVCKLRTGVVLAKQGGAFPKLVNPVRLFLGATFGNGQQMVSWIHLQDLVSMYLYAVQYSWDGVYNAVAPNPVSNRVMTHEIAGYLHKPIWLPGIPRFVMKLLLGEMHQVLFEDKNVSSSKAEKAGFHFHYPTIQSALTDLLK